MRLTENVSIQESNNNYIDKEKKKNNNKLFNHTLSFLTVNNIDSSKITFNKFEVNDSIIIIFPEYKYADYNQNQLILLTDFLNVDNYIKFTSRIDKDKNSISLKFDPCMFSSQLINFMIQYDKQVKEYVKKKFIQLVHHSKLVGNFSNGDEDVNLMLPLKYITGKVINDNNFKSYNKIINYNISRKYPKKEEMEINDDNIDQFLKRVLNNKKQVRLLMTPATWLNFESESYGSYLKIIMMEVKYKGATITSEFDNDTVNITNMINKITI